MVGTPCTSPLRSPKKDVPLTKILKFESFCLTRAKDVTLAAAPATELFQVFALRAVAIGFHAPGRWIGLFAEPESRYSWRNRMRWRRGRWLHRRRRRKRKRDWSRNEQRRRLPIFPSCLNTHSSSPKLSKICQPAEPLNSSRLSSKSRTKSCSSPRSTSI
jgi:hypothetical protein